MDIADEAVRQVFGEFIDECKHDRCLSRVTGIGVGRSRKLGHVVRAVAHALRKTTRNVTRKRDTPDNVPCPEELRHARDALTGFCFRELLQPEFKEAAKYGARWDNARQCFSVTHWEHARAVLTAFPLSTRTGRLTDNAFSIDSSYGAEIIVLFCVLFFPV
eukprot:GHVU01104071.1.p1 GENE.GHVU01104071.1~~GHVU01104071.1.p1  ORF type:complete len:161 (-),score=7.97 GHVU01104071.1:107-589(-)